MDKHTREHLHETSWVITLPLILLAIPSMFLGGALAHKMLYAIPIYWAAAFRWPRNMM